MQRGYNQQKFLQKVDLAKNTIKDVSVPPNGFFLYDSPLKSESWSIIKINKIKIQFNYF